MRNKTPAQEDREAASKAKRFFQKISHKISSGSIFIYYAILGFTSFFLAFLYAPFGFIINPIFNLTNELYKAIGGQPDNLGVQFIIKIAIQAFILGFPLFLIFFFLPFSYKRFKSASNKFIFSLFSLFSFALGTIIFSWVWLWLVAQAFSHFSGL